MSLTVELPCTIEAINNFTQYGSYRHACAYVKEACADETSTVDFFQLHYCNLDESAAIMIIIGLAILAFVFYFLSTTAEDYVEPALAYIGEKLHFSKPLTGVTLVSLANGLPDVITAFAAGDNLKQGVMLPIGSLLGAGVFTTTVVLGRCLFVAPEGKILVDKRSVSRDIFFYILGIVWLLIQGFFGVINIIGGIGFLVIYACFMGAVLSRESYLSVERNIDDQENEPLVKQNTAKSSAEALDDSRNVIDSGREDDDRERKSGSIKSSPDTKKQISKASRKSMSIHDESEYQTIRHEIHSERRSERLIPKKFSFLSIITLPLTFIRQLTIPASDQESWNKKLAMVQPFTVGIFLIWRLDSLSILANLNAIAIYLIIAILISCLLWTFTLPEEFPKGIIGLLLLALSLITGVLWINLMASIIIDFIAFASVASKLPINYIGLTIVAWGNSLNDFFIDGSLAKKGLGEVSISGIFAGQFFNMAIGFGFSLIRQGVSAGPQSFYILKSGLQGVITIVLVVTMLTSLLSTYIYGRTKAFSFYRKFAIYLVILYGIFFIVASALILAMT